MDDITKHDPHHAGDPEENPAVAYEHGDADIFTVSKYGIALAFGVLIAASAMWGLFDYFNSHVSSEDVEVPRAILDERPKLPPSPRLQQFPKVEMKGLRENEERQLSSYGWVDQKNGIVRIPIEEAINAVASQGTLKSRPLKPDEGLDADGNREIPSDSSGGRTREKIR